MPILRTSNGKFRIENVAGESQTYRQAAKRLAAIKINEMKRKKVT